MPGCEPLAQPATTAQASTTSSRLLGVSPSMWPRVPPSTIIAQPANMVARRPRAVWPMSLMVTNSAVQPPATPAAGCPSSTLPTSGMPTARPMRSTTAWTPLTEPIRYRSWYQRAFTAAPRLRGARSLGPEAARRRAYSLKITTVVLPVNGIEPPLCPEATATYCLPLTS